VSLFSPAIHESESQITVLVVGDPLYDLGPQRSFGASQNGVGDRFRRAARKTARQGISGFDDHSFGRH
jgi:hypothetical protein